MGEKVSSRLNPIQVENMRMNVNPEAVFIEEVRIRDIRRPVPGFQKQPLEHLLMGRLDHQINIAQPGGAAAADAAKTSGMAVTSFVLGLVGIFLPLVIPGVLAVIFGAVALNAIAKDAQLKGKGLAIAGLVIGIVDATVWIIALVMLWGGIMASLPPPDGVP